MLEVIFENQPVTPFQACSSPLLNPSITLLPAFINKLGNPLKVDDILLGS